MVLTRADVAVAASVASFKLAESQALGAEPGNEQDYHKTPGDGLAGYLGEAAVAQFLGVEWPLAHNLDFERRHEGDLKLGKVVLEVRATRKPNHAHLLLQERDHADRRYVLAIPAPQPDDLVAFEMVGFAMGSDVMQKDYWQERIPGRPCYWYHRTLVKPFKDREGYDAI